ncbi:hypothetical protein PV325_004352 [Microctonus aethiopoides]|uniref:Tubulin-specific chaperone E n=1 Tax=Microctonus aethiopoides TaxID=144406 RepID=A0AA39KU11_9HYME|nr:hypothetical protein PV325_004352 [Microctonus aethiopoides]KAK0173682.1 hypothetical protein PV328_006841 [Microctonus aethiopoides]
MVENVNTMNEYPKLADRIDCDGHRGNVCYVGLIDDTNGMWLGIDWDDPSRGKHNGIHGGKEYFKTRHPTSGSFVRPGKVKCGISCPDSIKDRYGLINDDLAGVDRNNISSLKREINAPFLEMVGFSKVNKKQSTFNQLRVVSLREQLVSNAGAPGELAELCPNIEELDISKSLINSWSVIIDIGVELQKLIRLDLSENNLPTKEKFPNLNAAAFPCVTQLTMIRMNYDWSDIEWCTSMFPALRILYVAFNRVNTIEHPLANSNLAQIVDLSLENNDLDNWDEIIKLGELTRLEILNLNANRLDKIRLPSENATGKTYLFPALQQLHLSKNFISEWRSISELEKLNNLRDLKFRNNPVVDNEKPETARQLIIARISKLKLLNNTEIARDERNGAEWDYLKLFANEWLQVNIDGMEERKNEFITNHPRYPALIELCGGLEFPNERVKTEMKSDVITIEFVSMNETLETSSKKKKLLKDMDVQKLTGIAQRLFKTGRKIPILSIQSKHRNDEIPLDKPLQQLNYYSIQNDDRILVRW